MKTDKYVAVTGKGGRVIAAGILECIDDEGIHLWRSENETILILPYVAESIHFFKIPTQSIVKYMENSFGQSFPSAEVEKEKADQPLSLAEYIEQGPPGNRPTGVTLANLPGMGDVEPKRRGRRKKGDAVDDSKSK